LKSEESNKKETTGRKTLSKDNKPQQQVTTVELGSLIFFAWEIFDLGLSLGFGVGIFCQLYGLR
jgi:hypothetical protein